MTMRQAFDDAMHRETPDEAMRALREGGVWMADVDTMTQAIHKVYCGIMADHEHPNEKDRDQARQLIAAIGQSIGTGAGATKD
jgi:crotonobetainyl-CoA:carnitine CoA-transferase CaiB-like acyl-CoA transferase